MSNPIDQVTAWVNTAIPSTLWHYTSLSAFMSIVSDKKMFATDIRFLNDRAELTHARDIIQKIVADAEPIDDNGWQKRHNLYKVSKLLDKGFLSPEKMYYFVVSFSTAADQLSQWRGYSHGSSGASLGFDLSRLRNMASPESSMTFAPCIYDDQSKQELLASTLNRFATETSKLYKELDLEVKQNMQKWSDARPEQSFDKEDGPESALFQAMYLDSLKPISDKVVDDLIRLVAFMKHSAFNEEREWRLVCPVPKKKLDLGDAHCYRAGKTTLIPYIDIELSSDSVLPLTDVVLGPGSQPHLAIKAASGFLTSQNILVTPRESTVPFNPW